MNQTTMSEFAERLVIALAPQHADDRIALAQARDHLLREIKADTHGGHRKEWADVRKSLHGSDHPNHNLRLYSLIAVVSPTRLGSAYNTIWLRLWRRR